MTKNDQNDPDQQFFEGCTNDLNKNRGGDCLVCLYSADKIPKYNTFPAEKYDWANVTFLNSTVQMCIYHSIPSQVSSYNDLISCLTWKIRQPSPDMFTVHWLYGS